MNVVWKLSREFLSFNITEFSDLKAEGLVPLVFSRDFLETVRKCTFGLAVCKMHTIVLMQ